MKKLLNTLFVTMLDAYQHKEGEPVDMNKEKKASRRNEFWKSASENRRISLASKN